MKIAFIQRFLPGRSLGGVGYFTHHLCNHLVQRGHAITVFSLDPAPEEALYQVTQLPSSPQVHSRNIFLFPSQVAHMDFSAFDLIHAQGDDHLIPLARPPLVRTFHGSALREAASNFSWNLAGLRRSSMFLYFYGAELLSALKTDLGVAISRDTCRYYPRVHHVIPDGVDLELYRPGSIPKSSQPTLLFVGLLEGRKRGRWLLKLFQSQIRPRIPNAQLWLVCPEPASGTGVRWFGRVATAELALLYQQAWVFCSPSCYEGLGLPYLEALASGTPVVASPNPGSRELLEGGAGLLVPDRLLAATVCELLEKPDQREKYRARGLERAQSYAWDHIAEQYESVYIRVLHRGDSRGSS